MNNKHSFNNFDSLLKFIIGFIKQVAKFGRHAIKHIVFNMLMQLKGVLLGVFVCVCACNEEEI